MTTNFEIASTFASTLPFSLVSTATAAPARGRKSKVATRCAARPAAQTDVRMDLVNSLRRQIADGTYRVSAMQLADCMMNAFCA